MRNHHLLLAVATVLGIAAQSCSVDPVAPTTANEQYTQSFIKKFGLINPQQDWNRATEAKVTVNVGDHAGSVKIYALVGSRYYLCADLIDLSGTVTVPIDIPEGVTDLKVKVDNDEYYVKAGGSVDASRSVLSRTISAGTTTVTAASGDNITVSVATPGGDREYFKFNAQQMGPILAPTTTLNYNGSGTIPGTTTGETYYWPDYYSITPGYEGVQTNPRTSAGGRVPEEESNISKSTVHQDVKITLTNNRFTIYPMYWYTARTHTISVYFINKDGSPVRDAGGEILKVPVYTSKGDNDIQWYRRAFSGSVKLSTTDGNLANLAGWPFYVTEEGNPSQYVYAEGKPVVDNNKLATFLAAVQAYYEAGNTFTVYPVGSWNTTSLPSKDLYNITSIEEGDGCGPSNFYINLTFAPETVSDSYPEGYPEALKETGGEWVSWTENNTEMGVGNTSAGCYAFREEALMRSQGIQIDITGWSGQIGIHTNFEYDGAYSQKDLNTSTSEGESTSFAAFYFHPVTGALFFSFEDWEGTPRADLNDMVFMIEGVDHMDTNHGKIPVSEKTTTDDDTILSWIIAAEDLGSMDDFDFNDVIFRLSSVTTNHTEVENLYGDQDKTQIVGTSKKTEIHKEVRVQALAAGGTLPVWLHYNDGTTDYILGPDNKVVVNDGTNDCDDCEWHNWFGKPVTQMVNTGATSVSKPGSCVLGYVNSQSANDGAATVTDELWRISAFRNFSIANYSHTLRSGKIEGFYITVGTSAAGSNMGEISDGRTIAAPSAGEAPQMFLIPDEGTGDGPWQWPTERTSIITAYPRFADWVSDVEGAAEWHKTPSDARSVTRPTSY